MLRFAYDRLQQPPAPVVEIRVAPHGTNAFVTSVAKVDSGATRTVLPDTLVRQWRLRSIRRLPFRAYDGRATRRPIYRVDIILGNRRFDRVEVTAAPRTDILLGRDILNQFRIILDGPKQVVTIHNV